MGTSIFVPLCMCDFGCNTPPPLNDDQLNNGLDDDLHGKSIVTASLSTQTIFRVEEYEYISVGPELLSRLVTIEQWPQLLRR